MISLVQAFADLERRVRDAHAAAARASIAYSTASLAEGLHPLAGHEVLAELSRSSVSISDALAHAAMGHRHLRRLGRTLGYDVTSYGDVNCPPDEDKSFWTRGSLQTAGPA